MVIACEADLASLQLTEKHLQYIEHASLASKKSPLQVLTAACEWAFKFYASKYERNVQKNDTGAGSAYFRIERFLKRMMRKNDAALNMQDKVFRNQSYLMKHQGPNRDAIKGFLDRNAEMLEKHPKKHRLNMKHNAQVARFGRKSL